MSIDIKGKVLNLSLASTFSGAAAASISADEILVIDDLRAAPATSTAVKDVWGAGVTIPAFASSPTPPAVNIISGGRIFNFEISATYSAIGISAADTSNVTILNSSVSTTTLANYGIGTEQSADNIFGVTILGNHIDAAMFGILLNLNEQDINKDSGGFIVSNNRILSGKIDTTGTKLGDGIEINVPGIVFVGGVITGNWIRHYGDDTDFTGMGIGLANPQDFSVVGNSIQGASKEVIHLEDNHKGIAVVGNVGRGPYDGIKLNPVNHTPYDQKPATIIGNNVGWDSEEGPNPNSTFGISLFYSNPCSPSGYPVIGNVVRDYNFGIGAGGVGNGLNDPGPVVNIVSGNSILGCDSAIRMYGGKRSSSCIQVGTNYSEDCDYLFHPESSGCGTLDKVVSRTTPLGIFYPTVYTVSVSGNNYNTMPFTCKGFAYPLPSFQVNIGLTSNIYVFPKPFGPSRGRLYFHCQGSGYFDKWAQYWCDFVWSGAGVLTIDDQMLAGAGSGIEWIHLRIGTGANANKFVLEVKGKASMTQNEAYQISWLDVDGWISDS